MKSLLLIALFLMAGQAFAWNDVDCSGQQNLKDYRLSVERGFPDGSSVRRSVVQVTEMGNRQDHDFLVFARTFARTRRIYASANFALEIDTWPDNTPRWGRTYRGTFRSSLVTGTLFLNCRFNR